MCLLCGTRESTRYTQCRERGSSAGIPELDEIVLAAGHEQAHRRMPLDALDVPSVTRKDAFLSTLGERPDAHGRVVAGCGEALVVGRETETTHSFSMCGPCREVVHVRLEILDDPRLVCGRDVGAGVVEGQCADGGVVRL